ncbi:MAG: hypothetical protein A2086_16300 [Spirochaetes bacterium GWD1_27_9]|nr:MAG: hypothetical protein A2Y34_01540 [Spirochaetes bacterium GWC1_27_15]OHD37472.1 MAG: hypothetical protein A2086_16300 [Spirochaetes bacterium GWD1_27_9]
MYFCKERYNDKVFLKYKKDGKFESITFIQLADMVENLAGSLYEIGIRKGDKVGIISDNMYKWFVSDLAILSLGAADVPRGSDSTAQEVSYILKHSDAKYCFVENAEQAEKILSILGEIPEVKTLILLTGKSDDIKNPKKESIKIYDFDTLLLEGEKHYKSKYNDKLIEIRNSISREDLVTLIYTSGTTGLPKGVMLLHKNIMHNVYAYTDVLPFRETRERWISVLPVWHVFERTVEYIIMSIGCPMAYSKPTAKHLLPDLAEIKPTYMVSVPRIWEALYNGILNNIKKESPSKVKLFNTFINIGTAYNRAIKIFTGKMPIFRKETCFKSLINKITSLFTIIGLFIPDLIGDILVFSKIRKKTGGALICPISGGGALPEYVDNFFAAIKIDIFEGYGLTETSPIVSVRSFSTLVPRTVGRPAPGVEVMIGDNDWNKKANQHRKGIIYIKGDLVMAGYYKNPEKTKEILKDGWINTGDLGRLTLNGEIQITGRAKDTIVLMGGENIEPSPIEDKLLEDPLINQVIVVGQDKKTLGALIIPDQDNLVEFAKNNNIAFSEYNDLCNNKLIKEEFSKIIKNRVSTKTGFKSFEKITCFALIPTPFEIGKELTNSLKMKRNVISEKYKALIEKIYIDLM